MYKSLISFNFKEKEQDSSLTTVELERSYNVGKPAFKRIVADANSDVINLIMPISKV